jgi:hypothetical protein
MFKNIRGLFMGGRNCWSLGRVAFWLVFGLAFYRWALGLDITSGHESVLTIVILYNLSGKVVSQMAGRKISTKGDSE